MRIPKRKPCPHCRSENGFVERYDISVYAVVCNNCGAIGPKAEHGKYSDAPTDDLAERDATRMWNARTPDAYERVKKSCEM